MTQRAHRIAAVFGLALAFATVAAIVIGSLPARAAASFAGASGAGAAPARGHPSEETTWMRQGFPLLGRR